MVCVYDKTCEDSSVYTGITTDMARRFEEHGLREEEQNIPETENL